MLVVDDEEPIREILSRRLQQWGHEVVAVATADAALDQMRISPFPIVFCDLIMPVHDGVWLFKQILSQWPDTIVVAVSGAQDEEVVVQVRRLGAVDFVPKPIGRETLHQAVERAVAMLQARPSA